VKFDDKYVRVLADRASRRRELDERVAEDWADRREAWHATQFGTGEAS